MSRGVNFIRSVGHSLDYREDHRGIPFRILFFMGIVRAVAFYVVTTIPLVLLIFVRLPELAGWYWFATSIYFGISTNNRLDFFTPLGFQLFKVFITKR